MYEPTRRGFISGTIGAITSFGLGCERSPEGTEVASSRPEASGAGAPEPPRASNDPARTPPLAPMPMRELGRSGEKVSALGLGGFHIGKQPTEAESVKLIRTAIDEGITFLDNCWDYHDGESERRMGKALADGYRQRVFLMSKIDGRTREAASAQIDQSLQRLATDVLDLMQMHEIIRPDDPERCFAKGGSMEALVAAREAGKIRYIGFTGHKDPAIHLAMLETAKRHGFKFDAVQMPLNVMDAHYQSFEAEVLPALVEGGIGVLGMKSCGGGEFLKANAVTAEECLRYALSLPTSVVISGMDSEDVLKKNIALARAFQPLSAEEKKDLLARTKPLAEKGELELFKTSAKFDGTVDNPHWLDTARL